MATKYIDENGLLYLWGKIKALIPTKVSELTNDSGYLTAHQDISGKLDKTGDGADVTVSFSTASSRTNVVTGEKMSTMFGKIAKWFTDLKTVAFTGSYNDLSDTPTIPTAMSDLTNDSGFQTESQVQTIVNNAIGEMTGISYEVVESLPSTGVTGIIYLISNDGSGSNIYDEYIWVNSKFENIGTTAVDLSGYVQTSDLVAITNAEIDTITA